jgi:hypothetical protein
MERLLAVGRAAGLIFAGCGDDDDGTGPVTPTDFTVTIQSVSTPGQLNTPRAMGAIPLSPGVFAVFTGSNPAFTEGQLSDIGTERIAEDGFPGPPLETQGTKSTTLAAASNVSASGIFQNAGGMLGPAFEPGTRGTFTFSASPGDLLTLETMFVQSNDWFYALDGLELFDSDGEPISGDVTSELELYDSGTEQDTPPGTGDFQKPVQTETAVDFGPDESVPIQLATQRHPTFTIPATAAVIRLTITPQP